MCADGSDETTAEVCADSLWSEVTIAERVEHSSVCAQESAPAHTDSCEHCNGVAVNPTMLDEAGNQAQGCSYSTESSDRERYEVWSWKPKSHSNTKSIWLASQGRSSTP